MKIYCLISTGTALTDEILNLIFDSAQQMLARRDNKMRLKLPHRKLKGEIRTGYKVGFMGAVAGIVCSASLDWDEGTASTDFIVRPTEKRSVADNIKWMRTPLFPETSPASN